MGLSFPEFWGRPSRRPIYPTTRKTKKLSSQFPMLWPSPGPPLFTRLARARFDFLLDVGGLG